MMRKGRGQIRDETTAAVRLVSLNTPKPHECRLSGAHISIGSAPGNDFVVTHPSVSRRHAVIQRRLGRFTVRDLESTNGTYVNARRIREPTALAPGDEIKFGGARFALVAGAPRRSGKRSTLRGLLAVTALGAIFVAGFLATKYAITWDRIEELVGRRTAIEAPASIEQTPTHSAPSPALAMAEPKARVSGSAQSSPSASSSANAESSAAPPPWLARLNYFRALAGLRPVVEDPELSDGDRKHAVYLVKNYGPAIEKGESLGIAAHTEDPSKKWYTPEGRLAAGSSDETEWVAPYAPGASGWSIEDWMATPFHRLWILSPLLGRVGYGQYCEGQVCVAMLNVIGGAAPAPRFGAPLKDPVQFPPPGATIPATMTRFDAEWPDPLTSCDGYSYPIGIAVTLQLGPMVDVKLSSYSLTREGAGAVETCGIDAASYRNPDAVQLKRVVDVLRGQGAVALVPKTPLVAGSRYDVSMTVNGHHYDWSFAIGR